jgi:HEAT repeat protein
MPSCLKRVPWLARLRGWRKHGAGFLCPDHRSTPLPPAVAEEDNALAEHRRVRDGLNRRIEELAAAAPEDDAEVIRALSVHPDYPDQDKRERLEAVRALEGTALGRAIPALTLALRDPIADVAYMAVEVLQNLRQVAPLAQLLQDERLAVHAAGALGRIGDAAAIDPLAGVWNDRHADPLAQVSAVKALAQIGGSEIRPIMLKLLAHREPHVRRIGLDALRHDGSEEAAAGICSLLKKDSALRREAAEALGEMRAASAVPALIGLLGSREDWVAGDAAEALGKIGDPRALAPLLAHIRKLEPDDPDQGRFADAIRKFPGSQGLLS